MKRFLHFLRYKKLLKKNKKVLGDSRIDNNPNPLGIQYDWICRLYTVLNLPFDDKENIEKYGYYYVDNMAFKLKNARPYRLHFKTGIVSDNLQQDLKIDGIYGRKPKINEKILIEIKTTEGIYGNLPSTQFNVGDILVESLDVTGVTSSKVTTIKAVSVTGGSGGSNLESKSDIKRKLLNTCHRQLLVNLIVIKIGSTVDLMV